MNFERYSKNSAFVIQLTSSKMKLFGCLLTLMLAGPSLSEQKILSLPNDGKPGPQPCTLTCSGVTRYEEIEGDYSYQTWMGDSHQSYRYVNFSDCGFVSAPVVTATLNGPGTGDRKCPPIYITNTDRTLFMVTTTEDISPSQMMDNKCDVYWTANGYDC